MEGAFDFAISTERTEPLRVKESRNISNAAFAGADVCGDRNAELTTQC